MNIDPKLEELGADYDETLRLNLLHGGELLTDADGKPVLDSKGRQVRKHSAPFLQAVRGRLSDCNISGLTPNSKTRGIGGTVEQMRRQGLLDKRLRLTGTEGEGGPGDLPPVSEDRDAATG